MYNIKSLEDFYLYDNYRIIFLWSKILKDALCTSFLASVRLTKQNYASCGNVTLTH